MSLTEILDTLWKAKVTDFDSPSDYVLFPLAVGTGLAIGTFLTTNYLRNILPKGKIGIGITPSDLYRVILHVTGIKKIPQLEDYAREPGKTKMDNLSSFAKLGIDVKITPNGEVKIIEINGFRAGMNGYEVAEVKPHFNLLDYMLMHKPLVASISLNPFQDKLFNYLDSLGETQCRYVVAMLSLHYLETLGKVVDIDEIKRTDPLVHTLLTNSGVINPEWHERYGDILLTLVEIEKILKDKAATDELLDISREIKPVSYGLTRDNVRKLISERHPGYIVIKPRAGSLGKGVEIIKVAEFIEDKLNYRQDMVVEEFIPSKPIKSSITGEYHDGCMRFVELVEEKRDGRIQMHNFWGYWRLAPRPIEYYGDINAMRANLTKSDENPLGALAERASGKDLKLVRKAMDIHIPGFYRRLAAAAREQMQDERKETRKRYSAKAA